MRHTVSSHLSYMKNIPKSHNIAIVGLPCHTEAAKKAMTSHIIPNKAILIGIACGTNYEYGRFRKMVSGKCIDPKEISSYTLRNTRFLILIFSSSQAAGKQE